MIPLSEPQPVAPARGFALFNLGFRPFYLLAALFAALAIPAWLALLRGAPWNGAVAPLAWHQHEMVFGFALAVIAGFLLTAGRVWTGRQTPEGFALAAIALHWVAARILMAAGTPLSAALVDGAFPFVLAIVMARSILGAGNRRNYFVPALLAALGVANLLFHLEQAQGLGAAAGMPMRVALYLVLFLVVVMAGRVVPAFTASALPQAGVRLQPRLDRVALALTFAAFALAAAQAPALLLAPVAFLAALLHALRQAGWKPFATASRPILWILHLSHAWIPAGFVLLGLAALGMLPQAVALHAFGLGVLGGMVIGMITRTALGHTGRALAAGRAEIACFILVHAAALTRVLAGVLAGEPARQLVLASAALWSAAFLLYAIVYAPRLARPRVDGRPG